jgi:hypothetical protein
MAKPRRFSNRRHAGNAGDDRFLREHGIVADVEMIRIQDINKACERLLKNDVRYRFVIDIASLK